MYPLVRELTAKDAPIRVPVTVTCRVLKIASQPYYRWLATPVSDADLEQAYRANALFDAHKDDPEFGYRFLVDEAREAGEPMAQRTAWRICSQLGWWSAFGKPKRGKAKKPGPPVHDDLCAVVDDKGRVRHEVTADAPNELWLTDITEHRTGEGKLYVCAIKDVYSNRIVGYSISDRIHLASPADAGFSVSKNRGQVPAQHPGDDASRGVRASPLRSSQPRAATRIGAAENLGRFICLNVMRAAAPRSRRSRRTEGSVLDGPLTRHHAIGQLRQGTEFEVPNARPLRGGS